MYDEIYFFENSNYTVARKGNKIGLVDVNTGKPLTKFTYDRIRKDNEMFSFLKLNEDYCPMKENGKWGLLDSKGKVVFDFIYESSPILLRF